MIEALQHTTSTPIFQPNVEVQTGNENSSLPLFQRAANYIVAQYLQSCGYEYSLSTFLPESGTNFKKVELCFI